MNKSQLFRKAHKITKEIKGGSNYRATFSLVLRTLYKETRNTLHLVQVFHSDGQSISIAGLPEKYKVYENMLCNKLDWDIVPNDDYGNIYIDIPIKELEEKIKIFEQEKREKIAAKEQQEKEDYLKAWNKAKEEKEAICFKKQMIDFDKDECTYVRPDGSTYTEREITEFDY